MYFVIEWRLNEYQISLIYKNPYLLNAIVIRSSLEITYELFLGIRNREKMWN